MCFYSSSLLMSSSSSCMCLTRGGSSSVSRKRFSTPLMRRRLSPVPPLDSSSTYLPSMKRLAVFLMSRSLYDFSAKHGFLTEKCIKDRIDASFRCDRQSVIMHLNELNPRSTAAVLNGTHNNNSTKSEEWRFSSRILKVNKLNFFEKMYFFK